MGVIEERPGSSDVRQTLARSSALKVKTYHSLSALRRDVRRGRMIAGVVIPAASSEPVRLVSQPGRVETVTVRAALTAAVAAVADPGAAHVPVTIRSSAGRLEPKDPSPYAYTSAANLVLFTFVNSLAMAVALVSTRRLGVTHRMLSTPTSASTVVLGELLGRLGVAAGQAVALLAFGTFIFGVDWGDPIGVAAVVILFVLVSTGAGLLVGTLARSEEQAISVAIPIGVGLGMLGGCMWGLDIVGPLMRVIGHLAPHAWAMDAFIRLVLVRDGVSQILPQLAALAGFAATFLTLATWRMRRSVLR
jgi:ABC-2 type transport system permease protein